MLIPESFQGKETFVMDENQQHQVSHLQQHQNLIFLEVSTES